MTQYVIVALTENDWTDDQLDGVENWLRENVDVEDVEFCSTNSVIHVQ